MSHVKEHLGQDAKIKLHKCPNVSWYQKWTRILNRVNYTVTKHTRICSNHFYYGQPREKCPHPSMYLKGYDQLGCSKRRKVVRKFQCDKQYDEHLNNSQEGDQNLEEHIECHNYEQEIATLKSELEVKNCVIEETNKYIRQLKQGNSFGYHRIKDSDYQIKVHTGLPSAALFTWIFNEVKDVASNMKYYKGEQSMSTKFYQEHNTHKPGPKRKLCLEDELLMTLMKLRLNLNQDFIASMFDVTPGVVSVTISTWISLLALELKPLIHWPSEDQLLQYYPECFNKYGQVVCIVDCTEVQTERPSLDSVNSIMYSNYKERHTFKVLVGCTPGGSVSYISQAVGGEMSDVELVRRSGFLQMLKKNDKVMADKGFTNKDDFSSAGVDLITPEFKKKDVQFSVTKNIKNAEVSNARIHVERVIGRLKDFQILQGPIPLCLTDLVDSIFTVCGSLVNLMGILVPLTSKGKKRKFLPDE